MKKILYIIIFILILFSVYMRFRGIFWGLPTETLCLRSFASDECTFITLLSNMNPKKLDLDFDDPNTLKYRAAFGAGNIYGIAFFEGLFGIFGPLKITADRSFYEKNLKQADYLYIAGRMFVLIVSVLTIFFVYLSGKAFYNKTVGLISALILGLNFIHIQNSYMMENHTLMIFFVSVFFYICSKIIKENKTKYYYIAGFILGVATQNSLFGILAFSFLIAINFLNHIEQKDFKLKNVIYDKKIYIAFLFLILGYILEYPYVFIHIDKQIYFFTHQITGKLYSDISSMRFYLFDSIINTIGVPLYLLSIVSIIFAAIRRRKIDIALIVFIIICLLFFCRMKWQFLHYELIIYIPLSIITGSIIYKIEKKSLKLKVMIWGFLLISVFILFCFTMANFKAVIGPDSRLIASRWIEKNVPPREKIGAVPIGWTTPPILQKIGQKRYNIKEIPHDIEMFKNEQPKYFVFSSNVVKNFMISNSNKKKYRLFTDYIKKHYKNVKIFKQNYSFLGIKSGNIKYSEYEILNPIIYIYYN